MSADMYVLRDQLIGYLPTGRQHAISAKWLAHELGTSTRVIGELVELAIIEDGYCIGSSCGPNHGYFLVRDAADLEAGVAHTVKRAAQSFKRVRALERNWAEMSGGQGELFVEFAKAVSGGAA